MQNNNAQAIAALKRKAGVEGDEVERLLLWHAAQGALPQVPSLPVEPSVRRRLEDDIQQLHRSKMPLTVGSYHFDRASKMVTLRRFPAGPMEWEVSGIPRRCFLQGAFAANLRFLAFVIFRTGGFAPFFYMHVAPSPRNRGLSVPAEVCRSYYRMARSLELQPEVRGLVAYAWFHDPAALRDHPHLEAINRPYLKHGGLITVLGPAPADSGVLQGNAKRSADYLSGKVQYRYGFAVWPREAAVQWAKAHPEYRE